MRRHARALSPPRPAPPRHHPQVTTSLTRDESGNLAVPLLSLSGGGCFFAWQITALSAWSFRGVPVGFFSTDASAAQGGSKPVATAAGSGSDGSGEGGGRSGKSEQADAGKPVRGGPISWLSFLLLLVTGGGIVVYYDKEKKRHIEELNKTSSVKQGQSVGTATIGGPFTLLNHDGKPVTEKDFLGKWTLLYFGFTHCPDICPDELQKMAAAIGKIKERAKLEIVPILITVDPDRHC